MHTLSIVLRRWCLLRMRTVDGNVGRVLSKGKREGKQLIIEGRVIGGIRVGLFSSDRGSLFGRSFLVSLTLSIVSLFFSIIRSDLASPGRTFVAIRITFRYLVDDILQGETVDRIP
jgi:hypothetical protein